MTLESLRDLPEDSVRTLARGLSGKELRGKRPSLLTAIERALADPERLRAVVEDLPEVGRRALELCCVAGDLIDEEVLAEELGEALGRRDGPRALAAIQGQGLLVRRVWSRAYGADLETLGVYPDLAAALLPLFDAWHNRARDPAERVQAIAPAGLPFATLVLLAHLANVRPRVVRNEPRLYKKDVKELVALFAALGATGIDAALGELFSLGLVCVGEHHHLEVDAEQTLATLSAPAAERAAACWSYRLDRLTGASRDAVAWLARRPFPHPRATVHQVFRLIHHGAVSSHRMPWYRTGEMIETEARLAVEHAIDSGLLCQGDDEGESLAIHPEVLGLLEPVVAPEEDREAPVCHVQPNFEVIVPPEAAPATIFAVGRACRLVRFDAVATFALTRDSVRQAVMLGDGAETILADLEAASAHGVPPNVTQGVRDFAAGVRRGHLFTGVVVVLPNAEPRDTAELERAGLTATEVRGVFHSTHSDITKLVRKLEKKGIAVTGAAPSKRREPPASSRSGILASFRARAAPRDGPEVAPPAAATRDAPEVAVPVRDAEDDVGRTRLKRAALALGVEADAVRLLLRSLRHADEEWLEHFHPEVRRRIEDLSRPAGERRLLADEQLLRSLHECASHGFECCDAVLVGPAAVQRAIAHCHDVLLAQPGGAILQLTPHRLARQGREQYLTGHVAGDGEHRGFALRTGSLVARGPETAPADLALVPDM